MIFKIDENLPAECAVLLRGAGFGADTVAEENLEGVDDTVIARSIRAEGRDLWIVEPDRIRFRAQ